MNQESYQREITVNATPEAVYVALTKGFGSWWIAPSKEISEVGDEVSFHFPPSTSWTMRAEKLQPHKAIVLKCIKADHHHEGLPDSIRDEWLGTSLDWEIIAQADKTLIRFTHTGLISGLGCYEICEAGWDHFFVVSLREYLDGV
ncbi:MAG: SRPBCC domain-containing protein [Thiohalomonadales bacterium]